jgi:hypothetical protein
MKENAMRTASRLVIGLLLVLSVLMPAAAQDIKPESTQHSGAVITASASGERVRFAAPSSVMQIRLEVYNSTGKKLFDNEVRGGNVLDWHLQGGQAEPLSDDAYLCVITAKSLSGKITQRIGSVKVEKNSASVQPFDASQMTAQQSQAIGPVEENPSLTVLNEDDNRTTTVIAHNGEEGQITRGRGALSFRIGDFFSGKDTEQMRLTPEGNLGIGLTHPLVRLDVDGLLRASQGIVFPDGSIQYSAATKTFGAKSSLPDPSFQSLHSKPGNKGGQEHIDAAGTGTLNFISKWAETGGAGTLQNSSIFDDGFNLGVGTSSPGGVFDLQRGSSSDLLQRFWNTGTGGAKLRYVASAGATSQIQLTDLNEWLMSIAGNNSIGLQFRVRDVGDANDEATLAAKARMSILRNGNVGIGTPTPARQLHIKGTGDVVARIEGDANSPDMQLETSVAGVRRWAFGTTGNNHPTPNAFFLYQDTNSSNGLVQATRLLINQSGNVGIGITNPGNKLHVDGGSGDAVRGVSTSGRGLWGQSNSWQGVYGYSTSQAGVVGESGGNGSGFDGVFGSAHASCCAGVSGHNDAGGVGVWGGSTIGVGVYGVSAGNARGVWGESDTWQGVYGHSRTQAGVVGESGAVNQPGFDGVFGQSHSSVSAGVSGHNDAGGYGGYFETTGNGVALRANGLTSTSVLQITGGSDLAEHFEIAGGGKPGLVVAIDPRNPGKLSIARGAYNRHVAGVVSGANNLSAGMLLPDPTGAKNSTPVTLTGRVWVYCDATRHPITPGDLLTTSFTPGHAMKVINYVKAQGAIIGKAMTTLKSGRGLVLVLVTLQ